MGRVSWSVGMKEDSSQLKGEERWFCRKEVKDKSLLSSGEWSQSPGKDIWSKEYEL